MIRTATIGCCLLMFVGTAEARNLPKVAPTQKVQACSEMGPGFVRIEGSETCVKLSGGVRVEFGRQSGGSSLIPDAH